MLPSKQANMSGFILSDSPCLNSKGQHLNISQGCANVSTIHQMFSYKDVENVHREVEAARNIITQDMTIRRMRAFEPVKPKARKGT